MTAGRKERRPALVLDNRVGRSEPEPGAPSALFGREEWLEHAQASGGIHSRPGVLHRDPHVVAGLQSPSLCALLRERHVGGFDLEPTAVGHGLPRIDVQVEHHLLELRAVHVDRPQIRIEAAEDSDFLLGAAEDGQGCVEQSAEVGGLQVVSPATREAEQLPGKRGAAVHQLIDAIDVRRQIPELATATTQQRRVAANPHQQVVEIVGDATRQRANGLHLLGFGQRLLQPSQIRDVQYAEQHVGRRILGKRGLVEHVDPIPGERAVDGFALEARGPFRQRDDHLPKRVERFGDGGPTERPLQLLLRARPVGVQGSLVDVTDLHHPERARYQLGMRLEMRA